MELIRTIRERSQTKRQAEIHKQAEETITLSDFGDSIYIAYAGVPLVLVEQSWASPRILEELDKLRQNYINAKMKEVC